MRLLTLKSRPRIGSRSRTAAVKPKALYSVNLRIVSESERAADVPLGDEELTLLDGQAFGLEERLVQRATHRQAAQSGGDDDAE